MPPKLHRRAVRPQHAADELALVVAGDLDVGRVVPGALAVGVLAIPGLGDDHALGQQVGEGLVAVHQPLVAHQLVEEARVEQVQHRVLDAADVLIHRQPVLGALVEHGRVAVRRAVAGVVPAGLEEGVEGVGLSNLAVGELREGFHFLQRRAGAVDDDVFRQADREVGLGADAAVGVCTTGIGQPQ
jgi:hypothetical protein